MGSFDISGLGKAAVPTVQQGVKTDKDDKKLQVLFAEVMSQMQTSVGDGRMPEGISQNADSAVEAGRPETDYGRCKSREVKWQERPDESSAQPERISEKLEQFEEEVKEVLKEELGVSDEEIAKAMETLGLNVLDLLDTKQLALLVSELTGAKDVGSLLCSETFMTVWDAVGLCKENLLEELGISGEELAKIMQGMQEMDGQAITESAKTQEQELDAMPKPDASDVSEPEPEDEMTKFTVVSQKDGRIETGEPAGDTQMAEDAQVPAKASENAAEDSNGNQTFLRQQTPEQATMQSRTDMAGAVNQNMAEAMYAQAAEHALGQSSQVDVANVIRQIVEYARVTLGNTATTMEMQLNPEHLGKIYMELTSKEGVVSAHITAQNEAVKEVLESQLVEFRQNMNQAGVKVEAIEVTVESHAFEKNLEQNAKQEERQAQEQAAKQTRQIHIGDLDELAGMMTEEESLVAQMMAEQGNSIDFTA